MVEQFTLYGINMIKNSVFGDEKRYLVIKPLVEILDELNNNHINSYCVTFIQEYNTKLHSLNGIDKEMRTYLYMLIKEDFTNRLKQSIIPDNVKSHMHNLVVAIWRNKMKLINNK